MLYEFKFPDIGEGVVEGEIVRWLVKEGEGVQNDQPLVEIMTDKATVEIPSPRSGKIVGRFGEEGEVVAVGSTLVVIETETAEPAVEKKEPPAEILASTRPTSRAQKAPSLAVLATPAIRKLAQELGVDLEETQGTGPGGRITKEDVERATAPASPSRVETIPYRGLRKKIGEHMVASKTRAPHYTYVEEADFTELVRVRQQMLASSPGQEVRITYLPFIMKAVVEGLQKHPLLNSTLDEEKGVIQVKKYYNLGIATATPEGLIVPVVRDTDQKSVAELAREVAELSAAAHDGKIKLEDLRDGTFTITSLGPLGGILATPIINYPEVAILSVHKISPRPVVRAGEIVVRDMVYLSLSLDHRVVDGVIGAEFLRDVIAILESPGALR